MELLFAAGPSLAASTYINRRITRGSLDLISESGFAEYYDPLTGEPLGGGRFTWTAAMVIEFLRGV